MEYAKPEIPATYDWMYKKARSAAYTAGLKSILLDHLTSDQAAKKAPSPKQGKVDSSTDPKEGNKQMYFHFDTSSPLQNQQMQYLFSLASMAHSDANQALRKKFYMDDDARPETAEEFIEIIKAGKYTLADKETSRYYREFTTSYDDEFMFPTRMRLRDPAKPADEKGHEAANAKMEAEYQAVKTTIMGGDYAKGVKAVEDFAKTYETPTVH
jgi:hypothetical protein